MYLICFLQPSLSHLSQTNMGNIVVNIIHCHILTKYSSCEKSDLLNEEGNVLYAY